MDRVHASRSWLLAAGSGAFALFGLLAAAGCSADTTGAGSTEADDPNALTGEFVTYVADFEDGHSERWHALRTPDGREVRLDLLTQPTAQTGMKVRVHGDWAGNSLRVSGMDPLLSPQELRQSALAEGDLVAAPAAETYALVLVDLGSGVDKTAAQGQANFFSTTATDKSFALYYNESSYGKYTVTGDVVGPFNFSMTTCDTTGMRTAIEPMITATKTYNHYVYYFTRTSLCTFGGLGEEGSVARPAMRTWMNGSLGTVVAAQEPGHNLGLMHANTIKCGTNTFSANPGTDCTITEYGSALSTMGSGAKQFNAYERWYMQWLSGCNGVKVPGTATINLVPLETQCAGAVQAIQVPFPGAVTRTVNDPQATTTTVNLKNYYLELRTAGGLFDAFGNARGQGGTIPFTGPTVFVTVSDDVRVPTTTTRGNANSVWTELLNMAPTGTNITGLATAGQSFTDPAGGLTVTLTSISATGATISISNPSGTGSPTCIDGTTLAGSGPSACGAVSTGTGGTTGTGTGGTTGTGTGGTGGTATGTGGTTGTGTGGAGGRATGGTGGTATGAGGTTGTGTGGTGVVTGTGGTTGTGAGGTTGTGAGGTTSTGTGTGTGTGGAGGSTINVTTGGGGTGVRDNPVTGGCACSVPIGAGNYGRGWSFLACVAMAALARRRRRS